MTDVDLDALRLEDLRRRRGRKWGEVDNDVLAAWIADMDFEPAPVIREAIERLIRTGDIGYPLHQTTEHLPTIFAERMAAHFDWHVDPGEVRLVSDVVQGIETALLLYSPQGDGIVVQTPIYPPFLKAVGGCRRRLVENPLQRTADGWEMDLDQLRSELDEGTRVLLFCNPHNPTGRVFTLAELEALAEIVLEHDLLVISDEIHQDLVYSESVHIPFASLSPQIAWRTVTLTSGTKAFNIAGLCCAVVHIGNKNIRADFDDLPSYVLGRISTPGIAALTAAWTEGQDWQRSVVPYLQRNRDTVAKFLRENLPSVGHFPPEAGYMAWLDCRDLGLEPSAAEFFLREARVKFCEGIDFGSPGEGFVRLNFATSKAILAEILDRLLQATRNRDGL